MTKLSKTAIQKLHLSQVEQLQRILDAKETKAKHLDTRRRWLQQQNNANYRFEHDRLTNALANSVMPNQTQERMKERIEELNSLFSKGNL